MTLLRKFPLILKYLGPGWVAYRLRYAAERRMGLVARRSPCRQWKDFPCSPTLPEWLRAPQWPGAGAGWGARCVDEADGLSLGEFVLFSHHVKHLGNPPNWHHNSFTGQNAPRGQHWSKLGDFDFGDIKAIWEPSRFRWAFTLARAHARTGEARLAELFWGLFEDWCAQNPPNVGVNWKSGQEATFRLMAGTFAVAEFGRLPSATVERLQLWSRFVMATGQRIEADLDYALSQSNNHGVSECVGLITASLLTEHSAQWGKKGLVNLQKQLGELIYADGGFSQHSLVYHRVLLHDLFWVISLLRRQGSQPPDWLREKTRLALTFLTTITDAETGRAPLYGANDGANVLPWDECVFDDLRGTIQAGHALLDAQRIYPPGPWDEAAFWLIGRDPSLLPLCPPDKMEHWHAVEAGCFQWHSGETRAFLRCPTHFRHRPSQADMLHADISWRGRSIAHDAGTFSYNSTGPFDGALARAAAHNVPMLAGREPLQKVGRFLYLPWPIGDARWLQGEKCFRASHAAYGRDAQIERSLASPAPGIFSVADKIVVAQPGRLRLHWLLADVDWKLDLESNRVSARFPEGFFTISWQTTHKLAAVSLIRADPASARGWWSRHYLAVEPAVSLELLFNVETPLAVTTLFSPSAD